MAKQIKDQITGSTKAVIVAELMEDDSDLQTDYHGGHSIKRVLLATSKHERNLFSEMRKAADKFEGTAHLGTGKGRFRVLEEAYNERYGEVVASNWTGPEDKHYFFTQAEAEAYAEKYADEAHGELIVRGSVDKIEHRENYSMGGGYYLGHDRYHGWKISKELIGEYNRPKFKEMIERGECAPTFLDKPAEAAAEAVAPTEQAEPVEGVCEGVCEGVSVALNEEKGGVEISFPGKPDDSTLAALRLSVFEYHRTKKFWYAKATEDAIAFANSLAGTAQTQPAQTQPAQSKAPQPKADTAGMVCATENTQRRTVEIHQVERDARFDEVTESRLRRAGFRYSLSNKVWYAPKSVAAAEFANEFADTANAAKFSSEEEPGAAIEPQSVRPAEAGEPMALALVPSAGNEHSWATRSLAQQTAELMKRLVLDGNLGDYKLSGGQPLTPAEVIELAAQHLAKRKG